MPKNCKWIDKIRYRTVWLIELARPMIQAGMTQLPTARRKLNKYKIYYNVEIILA
jgi:hypothetical protein